MKQLNVNTSTFIGLKVYSDILKGLIDIINASFLSKLIKHNESYSEIWRQNNLQNYWVQVAILFNFHVYHHNSDDRNKMNCLLADP